MRLPDGGESDVKPNMTLAELRGLWHGATFEVTKPMVVSGVVTSSDRAGNFYHTFTIADETAAAEIRAGMRDLHNPYPIGCRLWVRLEGCAVGVERGVLQIGRYSEQSSLYDIDYLESRERVDEVVHSGLSVEPITARDIDICDITPNDCGRLVRIDSLKLVASTSIDFLTMTLDDAVWRGTSLYTDPRGDSLTIYTRDYATFADNALPNILHSVSGILESGKFDGQPIYTLKMRYESDAVAY